MYGSLSPRGGSNPDFSCGPSDLNVQAWVEVHIGCSLSRLLLSDGFVLSHGLVVLCVFVRGNAAHSTFMKGLRADGSLLGLLDPLGRRTAVS